MLNELISEAHASIGLAASDLQLAYKEACEQVPLAAMLMLPMIGELRSIEDRIGQIADSMENTRAAEIARICQQYAHPGCEPGSHALASQILKVLGKRGEAK